MRYLFLVFVILVSLGIIIACSGGGGGVGPLPTFDTSSFPTFTTTTTNPFPTTTTTTITTTNTTTTTNLNYKYLYVKVLRKVAGGGIEWLGSYDWNETAYVYFDADNWNNNKTVYVNDGYGGTYSKFNYDTYTVSQVDIGIYTYYNESDYIVKIGDNYYTSSEAWYGQFTVDSSRPYGSSIYIVFNQGVTYNVMNQRNRKVK